MCASEPNYNGLYVSKKVGENLQHSYNKVVLGYKQSCHITRRNSEDTDDTAVILFPIPDGKLLLDDLRSTFPSITSIRYKESYGDKQHHNLCRNNAFLEPEGGWSKAGRAFLAVWCSTAGRRGQVTIEKILKFATGSSRELLLGFSMNPTIQFAEVMFPSASTCINQLVLPVEIVANEFFFIWHF